MRNGLKRMLMLTPMMLLAPAYAAPPVPLVVRVPVCTQAPRVDGALDDACWKSAYVSRTFHDFALKSDALTPNSDTTLRLTTDGQWLFFGLDCKHPTPNDMKASIKQNFGGRVWGDESIKFFINPGFKDNGYFRYVLNCNNVYTIRRSFAQSAPSIAWPSATRTTKNGWSAEVAVPLFYMAGYADLGNFRLNVLRKKVIKEYDRQHVEVGFKEFMSSWSPTDEWLNMDEFARLEGLDKLKLSTPFVANIDHAAAGDLREEGGRVQYDVSMTLKAMTNRKGQAVVAVVETPLDGKPHTTSKTFALEPSQIRQITVPVVVGVLGQRDIRVEVRDAQTGMPFQIVQIKDTSAFKLLEARTRLNYYTSEVHAQIMFAVGMPKRALADKRLVARDASGRTLVTLANPSPKGELALPLKGVPNGRHKLSLALETKDGRKVFAVDFELTKLPSRPGGEWKIDRGRGGTLLHDGKPFFPFGFLTARDELQFKEIADAGMNTIVWWLNYDVPFDDVVRRANKYGLKIIVRPQQTANHAARMATLKKYFRGPSYKRALYGARAMNRLKGFLLEVKALTRKQRNEVWEEYLGVHLPDILDNVRAVRDLPNLIGYDTLDEPCGFSLWDIDRGLRRIYLEVKKVDPYHPMFVLYSSKIPAGPRATSFGDCLGTDPYWTPGRALPRGSINWMSITTATTVARARAAGQCPWTIPEAALWSDVIKRMLSPQEQICQTYLALIHGTKGILYFTHGWVVLREQWEAMKTLAAQIKVLAPALTAADTAQQITYTPGSWAPLKGDLPDVQARLIRFPDGRYVLLAANVRRSAVEVTVRVQGLQDRQVRDMFAGPVGPIDNGTFKDKLDARGVRAYAFDRIRAKGPVRIAVNITRLGKEDVIESGYREKGRKGMRNIKPNPSFEEATLPGWPDYYWPLGPQTGWRRRIGAPGAPAGLCQDNAFHGKRCVFIEGGVSLYWRIAPQHETDQPYVLSFYARTDSAEPVKVEVRALGGIKVKQRSVRVQGRRWKRYASRLVVPRKVNTHAAMLLRTRTPGRVYLDAIQLERGTEPTAFEP